MSTINCFNCAVVNIPQKSSSHMPHKSCRTEVSCETGYNISCATMTFYILYIYIVKLVNISVLCSAQDGNLKQAH